MTIVLDTAWLGRERTPTVSGSRVVGSRISCAFTALAGAAIAAAGCGDQPIAPKPIVADVALAPGQFVLYSGAQGTGPLRFPGGDTAGTRYLVVGQFTTSRADLTSSFALAGSSLAAGQLAAAPAPPPRAPLPAAVRFHDAIRRMDEAAARASLRLPLAPPAEPRAVAAPAVGSQRTFRVCTNLDCSSTATVTATAQVVGAHSAIYLDQAAPRPTFSLSDLQRLAAQFDTVLYPIDTRAFGQPSDIDGNGVIIILLTPKVNAIVGKPECMTSYIAGYFLASDLAPATRASWNNGEVFYAMVPDPLGEVSCQHTMLQVEQVVPPTFIHEFQHMISFNQHALMRRGVTETLWLNEAMSHLAEELGSRHYDSLGVDSTAARFIAGNLLNASLYLQSPAAQAIITTSGADDLEQRGGQWLFLRYLVDQYGGDLVQRLEQTSLTGESNVVNATGGMPLATLLGRWALAVYVSDLPSAAFDSLLCYDTWSFRAVYDSLHQADPGQYPLPFPLVPEKVVGGAFTVTGEISSGSGVYLDITQPAGAPPFTLSFTQASGVMLSASARPQLAIVRLR